MRRWVEDGRGCTGLGCRRRRLQRRVLRDPEPLNSKIDHSTCDHCRGDHPQRPLRLPGGEDSHRLRWKRCWARRQHGRCRRVMWLGRHQAPYPFYELRRRLPARQARPLHLVQLVRHRSASFPRIVDDDRNKKWLLIRHVVGAFNRKFPLVSEIALVTGFRMGRDKGYEQTAVVNPLANLPIPGVSASQLTLVEPHFDARRAQCRANALSCLGILRGIAQEHRPGRCARRLSRLCPHPRPLDLVRVGKECPEQPVSGNSAKRTSAFHQLNGWYRESNRTARGRERQLSRSSAARLSSSSLNVLPWSKCGID